MGQIVRIGRAKKAINVAFLSLMLRKSFEEITTTEIIEASGYSRGAFYNNYSDKYDLAKKIMENEIMTHVDVIAGTIKRRKRIVIEHGIYEPGYRLFEHVNNNRDLYRLILKSKMPGYTLDSFIVAVNERFKQEVDVEASAWPEGLSRDFYFYVNTYAFMIYIKFWETHDFAQSAEYMAEQVTYILNREKVKSVFVKKT